MTVWAVAAAVALAAACASVAAAAVFAVMRAKLAKQEAESAAMQALARAERDFAGRGAAALRSEFAALAAELLGAKAKDLSESNARGVAPLFDSLKERMAEFKAAAESARDANIRLGAELKAQIGEVGARAGSLGRQAEEFIAAIKGGGKTQGNWGEGIVRNVLEAAGLVPGRDFAEQEGARATGLPDFTVNCGAGRRLIIDAKVNIDAFLRAADAARDGDAEGAEVLYREHAKSVRLQIAGLSAKEYPRRLKAADPDPGAEYSPVVVMAMPSEATYAAALAADPSLAAFANSKGVALASPQMLFGHLALVKLGIDRLRVAKNNMEMAKKAELIVTRMDRAFAALEKLGEALEKGREAYADAMRRLGGEEGAQNVLVPARDMARLAGAGRVRLSSRAMQERRGDGGAFGEGGLQ